MSVILTVNEARQLSAYIAELETVALLGGSTPEIYSTFLTKLQKAENENTKPPLTKKEFANYCEFVEMEELNMM